MPDLEKQFEVALFDAYRRAKSEAGYNATIYLQMLDRRGGLDTAKYLINSDKPSEAIHTCTSVAGSISRSKPWWRKTIDGIPSSHLKSWIRPSGD